MRHEPTQVGRIAGATIGVTVLGAAFIVARRYGGLRGATLFGSLMQLMCVGITWKTV